ncbi:TIGR03915 family putative DNA repair protein [Sulfurospirillum arcachonense]|uniref:TIGR03915 family putative DNA repair protein n=1 Tax=Sulfurospirillum arcachonense TaxID=57666 RepID=UPI00046A4748|nr:TIGR03915 family putative DNA repair protein [Sulfurospirillum arcachonense]
MTLLYDGSYEGFLSLVYEVYYKRLHVKKIQREKTEVVLFEEVLEIQTDEQKSQKVLSALKKKFSSKNFTTITNIFLCDSKEFEKPLLEFIILGIKDEKNLNNINYPCILYIKNLEKEIFRVAHRMYGFVRFEELEDGTLYAKIETKYNVLYFLGKHFLNRLGDNDFIIHDIQREFAFVKYKNEIEIRHVASFDEPEYSKDEEKFKNLWKTFFQSVAIEKRKNKKLQQQLVPLMYRAYMSEFENDL